MTGGPLIHIFNGDADGLVAQHIHGLSRGFPRDRVTGWKRDIRLLRKLPALEAAELRVFDLSLRQNRPELDALLARPGVSVEWYDHHDPGEPFAHPRAELHLNQSPGACTAVIVNAVCGHAHPRWAAMAAFGDNLPATGEALLRGEGLDPEDMGRVARAGVLLNYNAYGERPGDVLFDPADLALRMQPIATALDFAGEAAVFGPLEAQFESDRERFRTLVPAAQLPSAAAFLLPDEPWARRFGATWANRRVLAHPGQALAILHEGGEALTVSIRSPREAPDAPDAAALANEFPTGGGRRLAAGINRLPKADVDRFLARFLEYYG